MACEKKGGLLLKWKVENFSFCHHEAGDCILSPIFFFDEDNEYCWMELYPRGENGTEGSISLALRRNVVCDDIEISYKIEVIGPSRKILTHLNHENIIISYFSSDKENVDRDIVMQDIQDTNQDTLTIHCLFYEINSHKLEKALHCTRDATPHLCL